jgi:hypothetical protein
MKKERTLFTMCRKKCLPFILSFCALIIYSATAYAQVNVSGTVTDQNNEPLIGVNVIVKDTREGDCHKRRRRIQPDGSQCKRSS